MLSCPVPWLLANPTGLTGQQGYLWRRATPAVWQSPFPARRGRCPPKLPACPLPARRGRCSPKLPVQRQLWVRGCGLVWWLSRICCTSCSTEKPELLFPLLQVHLMPWTMGRERQRGGQRSPRAGAGPGGVWGAETWVFSEHGSPSAGRLARGGGGRCTWLGREVRGRSRAGCPLRRSSVLFHCCLLPSLQCSLRRGQPRDLLLFSWSPSARKRLFQGLWSGGEGSRDRKERRRASEAPYPAQSVGSGDLERRRRLCARGGGPALEGSFWGMKGPHDPDSRCPLMPLHGRPRDLRCPC